MEKLIFWRINHNMSVLSKVITSIFGKKSDKDLKKILPTVDLINQQYNSLTNLNDAQLKDNFIAIKNSFNNLIQNKKKEFEANNLNANIIDGESELKYEFSSFIKNNKFIFPKRFSISVRSSENFEATLDYSKIVFNEKQKLPFKIPSSYAEAE